MKGLTRISAYIYAHKDLAVGKIMEAMRTAYAEKTGLGSNTSQITRDTNDHRRHSSIGEVRIVGGMFSPLQGEGGEGGGGGVDRNTYFFMALECVYATTPGVYPHKRDPRQENRHNDANVKRRADKRHTNP